MTFVIRMALRELRSSWQRLLFFFICIAIGVGAIVALRSVIQSVRNTFAGEARSLISAEAWMRPRSAASALSSSIAPASAPAPNGPVPPPRVTRIDSSRSGATALNGM